jgi:hypothetical protein
VRRGALQCTRQKPVLQATTRALRVRRGARQCTRQKPVLQATTRALRVRRNARQRTRQKPVSQARLLQPRSACCRKEHSRYRKHGHTASGCTFPFGSGSECCKLDLRAAAKITQGTTSTRSHCVRAYSLSDVVVSAAASICVLAAAKITQGTASTVTLRQSVRSLSEVVVGAASSICVLATAHELPQRSLNQGTASTVTLRQGVLPVGCGSVVVSAEASICVLPQRSLNEP